MLYTINEDIDKSTILNNKSDFPQVFMTVEEFYRQKLSLSNPKLCEITRENTDTSLLNNALNELDGW